MAIRYKFFLTNFSKNIQSEYQRHRVTDGPDANGQLGSFAMQYMVCKYGFDW
jgi:hypothetical protein